MRLINFLPARTRWSITTLLLFVCFVVYGQRSTPQQIENRKAAIRSDNRVETVQFSERTGTPELVTFRTSDPAQSYKMADADRQLRQKLDVRPGTDDLQVLRSDKMKNGLELARFQQSFKGIKVAHGQYLALTKDENLLALTGDFFQIPTKFDISPALSEQQALQFALNWVNADQYAWEYVAEMRDRPGITFDAHRALQAYYDEYLPKGELVIVDDFSTEEIDLDLAYKFNIYAAYPLFRAWIFVNARTGKIMLRDAIIKHAGGDTRYAGTRTFGSEPGTCGGGQNELLNTVKGGGFETRDMQAVGGLPLSIPALYAVSTCFTDNDGNWTEAEHTTPVFIDESQNDDFALDAHWGAETVYDYWFKKHGRLSYDNNNAKISSFVHYGQGYDNAFWNGVAMTYGDGSWQQGLNPLGGFAPLTSMDVCGHEIGHAVCTNTSDLVYEKESGAMNEGFSDIWAACIEHFVLDSIDNSLDFDPWGIGEQIDETDLGVPPGQATSSALRWMDHPKAEGNPDCYGGTNWTNPNCSPSLANDQCGVHNNSGVLNKWFYLMVAGSGQTLTPGAGKPAIEDGITDQGATYSFSGLGFEKAEKIAFLTETLLTPTSTFAVARAKSIFAAGTLYGACSSEQNIVAAAWNAVNVTGASADCTPRVEFLSAGSSFTEAAPAIGCNAKRTVSIPVYGISTTATTTVSAVGNGSKPATPIADFNLLTTSLNFATGSNKTIELEIIDDGFVELNETILISLSGFPATFTVTITDDDVNPSIGNSTVTAMATQLFSSTTRPTGWNVLTLGEGGNTWKFNGAGLAAGRAFITDGIANTTTYDQTVATHTILVTPKIDARGKNTLNLTFDWTAGGETDAVDPILFDYGSVGYSLDGENFTFIQDFVGTAGGAVMASGAFAQNLPASLNNTEFYVGFRWYNDALLGHSHSFTVDNVGVTGKVVPIETALNAEAGSKVNDAETVYFYNTTGKLIAKVKDMTAAGIGLGCVNLKIIQAGGGQIPLSGGLRSEKAVEITGTGLTSANSYQLTMYFTAAEIASWGADAMTLGMVKTTATNIADAYLGNSSLKTDAQTATASLNADGDLSYTATFAGVGKVVLQKDVVLAGCLVTFEETPTITLLKDVQARIDWPDVAGLVYGTFGFKHEIQYRVVGTSTWKVLKLTKSLALLQKLLPGTDYEYQLRNVCDLGGSIWSSTFNFTTSPCTSPVMTVSNLTTTTATVSWPAVPLSTKYYFQYRPVGGAYVNVNLTPPVNSINLTGLTPGTNYTYRIRVNCPWGISTYTKLANFTTPASKPNGEMADRNLILQDESDADASLWLFPNPATDALVAGFEPENPNVPVNLRITDQLGRTMFSSDNLGDPEMGYQEISIDISRFAAGIYILHFSNGEYRSSQKFVKAAN